MAAGLQSSGVWLPKSLTDIISDLHTNAQTYFGVNVDLTPASPIKRFINTVALEMSSQEQRIADAYYSGYIETATGASLDAVVAILGITRLGSSKASGYLTFDAGTAPATPLTIPSGTVVENSDGLQFQTLAIGTITSPATSVTVLSEAVIGGANGNAPGQTITSFGTPVAGIIGVTNQAAFAGGENVETDQELRTRAKRSGGTGGAATLAAITAALLSVPGVSNAIVIENTETVSTAEDEAFESNETGTGDPALTGSPNTDVAQRVVISDRRYIQYVEAKLSTDANLIVDISIETDVSGAPSGVVVSPFLTLDSADFNGTAATAFTFTTGAFLDPGVYWVRFTRISGTGTFDGGTGGPSDQVMKSTNSGTSWSAAATNENLNLTVLGGIPPSAIRSIVSGGTPDGVAQTLLDYKAAGIYSDGSYSGSATDPTGTVRTIYFERPALFPIVVRAVVTGGDTEQVAQVIISHIGGTDADDNIYTGIGSGSVVRYNQLIEDIMGVSGVTDVTLYVSPAENRIVNGGFEIYTVSPGVPDLWTSMGGTGVTFQKEQTVVYDRRNSVKVIAGATGSNQGLKQTITGLVVGLLTTAEIWTSANGQAGVQAAVEVYNETDGAPVESATGTSGSSEFERIGVNFTPLAGKTYTFRFYHATADVGKAIYGDIALVYKDATGTSNITTTQSQLPIANQYLVRVT